MELQAAHDKAVHRVNYKQTASSLILNGLHGFLDKSIALVEVRGSLVLQAFLVLFELSLVHEIVSQGCESLPAQLLFCRQKTDWNVPRYHLYLRICTPRVKSMAIWDLPHPA